jgi:hypothetical protein
MDGSERKTYPRGDPRVKRVLKKSVSAWIDSLGG